jgi:basic amino acid/polyamine antiporter, APA family
MMNKPTRSYLARKPLDMVRRDAEGTGMKRTLGATQLVFIGIGCIIGAGVYVMTGAAAANYAGPAVILSFVIAALACALICLPRSCPHRVHPMPMLMLCWVRPSPGDLAGC